MMILDSGVARSGLLTAHWCRVSPDHTQSYETNQLEVEVYQATEDGPQDGPQNIRILAAKLLITMPGTGEGTVTITYYNLSTGAVGEELTEPMPSILVYADEPTWAHIALDAVSNH